jgi:hypothetical protein
MRYEMHNLDGKGDRRTQVYDLPSRSQSDYWQSVTDVPCPTGDGGVIRWHEAGHVSGYRICDVCQRHFLARGTAEAPRLLRVGTRRG